MVLLGIAYISLILTPISFDTASRQTRDVDCGLVLIKCIAASSRARANHDDVIRWKHFRRYWPFVWGIRRSPPNSPHKGQWRGALIFSLICAWINGWVNNREVGDLRHHRAHYDVTVMKVSFKGDCEETGLNVNNWGLVASHTWRCFSLRAKM